jgi:hypothetical protein
MADSHPSANTPLGADDPRISEWLDGRLAPAEAMEVEQAVAASPELTLLVKDLRTLRAAMRTEASGVLIIDLGDRIMAAIASSSGSTPHVAAASRGAGRTPSSGRRLPWLGLLGALAAGLLVTIVINFPKDNGRDVALAPDASKDREAFDRPEARRESTEESGGRGGGIAKEGEERLAVADHKAAGQVGEELLLQERFRDHELKRQVPSEAPPIDALAANASPQAAPGKVIEGLAEDTNDESITELSGGGSGANPRFFAAPASPPPAATAPMPTTETSALAESKTQSLEKQEAAAAADAGHVAKRAKLDLAGVLVIAVTNASERQALDRLVAESGLETTREKDNLALVGKVADVDAFLQELTRVGLVSAVPARRAAEAGKRNAAEKKFDARETTLIVRVVERKGKPAAPVQAGEAETKP